MLQINPFDIPEILNRILTCTSILSANDLALTALVSKSWALASRRALWQDLELNSESWIDVHYNNLYKQLMRYGHFVRVLTLTDCGPDKARFCELMCMMKNLQVVLLDRLMLRGHASILQESLDLLFFPQLCVLKLPYMISSSSGPDILLRICNSAHKIQRLELMDSDFDGKALALIEEACQSLVSLDLSRNEVVTLNESITKHVAMDQVEEHWLGSKIPNTSPIVDTSFGLSTRTPTCGSTQNSNMLPLTQKMTDASSPLALQSRQHTHVHEFTSRKPSERHEFQDSRTQYGNIQRCCRPSLLEMRQPFMYLEELSLVFCLGITNSDFQTLFQSFHGKNLRSLDLQFTNIEDSGLETLADALTMRCTHPTLQSIKYTGITCVNVSFCSKITARGINALVKGCPQLLELEFLSCDSVSAECFQNTMPWACAGLKRLEFTVHPRVLFLDQSIKNKDTVNRRLSTTVSEEEGGSAAAVAKNHDPTPYRTINQGDQQSQMTAQHQKGNLLQRAHHGRSNFSRSCNHCRYSTVQH
ncbi:hypothetical protein BCR41DRAFT_164582 [Lobosporangium transversale]|uniref:F-box domain-containing protein n=1 Tax=Lobosporangium transversale TaxID=64571 RepID=A0A1Y2GGU1_9FUNG|nr:hypothetical protein BCR41DRAFT_164582 [Lobosporangium transversale]ORZ07065.1 hypothetical protein BCR41DRAFT_164582 [Lobosporangium transversale]|eukprot:XP_021877861.1 hypothetical protein BCR41DRAFT_164582 [Lobosporangium transversale]